MTAIRSRIPFTGYTIRRRQIVGGNLQFVVSVNFELMPKNITSVTFYEAATTTNDFTAGFSNWSPADTDFKQIYQLSFTSQPDESVNWSSVSNLAPFDYSYSAAIPNFTQLYVTSKLNATPLNLGTNLQHANVTLREFYVPRYPVSATIAGNSVVAIDNGDNELLVSTIDGSGDVEDDNFSSEDVDNAGRPLKIPLYSNGEMMGMQILNGVIIVFRRGEIETYDLQSGLRNIFPGDCVAKRSICLTPYGIVFAGQAGIYIMSDPSHYELLNLKWKNYYDGSYFLDGTTTPYLTSTMRSTVVAGHCPQYHLSLFHVTGVNKSGGTENLCYIYNHDKQRWFIRQFNIGTSAALIAFSTRLDNSFVAQYSAGLLTYPSPSSPFPWEDDVTIAGASASKGIPTNLIVNIGGLYGLIKGSSLVGFVIDCDSTLKEESGSGTITIFNSTAIGGSSSAFKTEGFVGGTITAGVHGQRHIVVIASDTSMTVDVAYSDGTVSGLSYTIAKPYSHNIYFFANNQTSAFDSKTEYLGRKSSMRKIAPVGVLER